MRRMLLAVVLLAAASHPRAQGAWTGQTPRIGGSDPTRTNSGRTILFATDDRLDRLATWLKAIDTHVPGDYDDALIAVGSWDASRMRWLWTDVKNLILLMRNPKLVRFIVQGRGRQQTEVVYTAPQLRRLKAFACAASGAITQFECAPAPAELDPVLRQMAQHASAERLRTGEDNCILRRAALLHADIAMARPDVAEGAGGASTPLGPERIRVQLNDGRGIDMRETGVHWELAEMALDQVKPRGAAIAAPSKDRFVRDWYHATAAWTQLHEDHDTQHLDHARSLFPDDADILFLSGTQHESYAAATIQAAVRSTLRDMPHGIVIDLGTDRDELKKAEAFLRRADALRPADAETRLHLGRVLGQLGRHAEAAPILRAAVPRVAADYDLRYNGELFLGAEEEALDDFDAARAAYERAAAMRPDAQSPLLALSQLARRRGDRTAARTALQRMFALSSADDDERDDPWWNYRTFQGRSADALLEALRQPYRKAP